MAAVEHDSLDSIATLVLILRKERGQTLVVKDELRRKRPLFISRHVALAGSDVERFEGTLVSVSSKMNKIEGVVRCQRDP